MCRLLIDDTSYRVQHGNDLLALDRLADKHYFREEVLLRLGRGLGFREVTFGNYEPSEFYDDFMRIILFTYGITDVRLTAAACRSYEVLRSLLGKNLQDVASHFKYIAFWK